MVGWYVHVLKSNSFLVVDGVKADKRLRSMQCRFVLVHCVGIPAGDKVAEL